MRGLTNSDVNFLSPYSGEFIHHTHFSTILGVVALRDGVTLSRGPLSSEKHKKCFININSSFDYSITTTSKVILWPLAISTVCPKKDN